MLFESDDEVNHRATRPTRVRVALFWLSVLLAAALVAVILWPNRAGMPLTAAVGNDVMTVLDFNTAFPAPYTPMAPPPGWRHRTFWFTQPMQASFVTHEGHVALRCETRSSGSILGRTTDIDVAAWNKLEWSWFVEVPITSERDEATPEGDDHPVRLFLEFRDTQNGRHAAEIIWANRAFKRGEYKYIGGFPHYVADAGNDNIGRWREEAVDLLEIYRTATGRTDNPRLEFIAVFCDSDNTRSHSIGYTSAVRLRHR